MSFTHTITPSIATPSGNVSPGSKQYSAAASIEVDEAVAIAATDKLVNIAFLVANVKSFYLLSDQVLTLQTNNGTTPDDTIVLKANVPYYWSQDSYDAFLLGTDITAFYFTNGSGVEANVKIRVLVDPTP